MSIENLAEQIENLVKEGWRLFESWKEASKQAGPVEMVEYEQWYSDTYPIVQMLLPFRMNDFERLYRSEHGFRDRQTYSITDFLNASYLDFPLDHTDTDGYGDGMEARLRESGVCAAIMLKQQIAILAATYSRLERAVVDFMSTLRAEIYGSELDAARGLLNTSFLRPAGALAGVVLEKHLRQVCIARGIAVKPSATISTYTMALKPGIDLSVWGFLEYLGKLRNLCSHANNGQEPTKQEVEDLISGTERITSTLF